MEAMAKKGNTMFYVETKYDGERVQLHRNESKQYRYFSRNGKDWTQQYGASTDQMGTLTPYIDDLFDSSVRNCILDGEMVGWDPTAETICTCLVVNGKSF
jgi:DNA ligase-4